MDRRSFLLVLLGGVVAAVAGREAIAAPAEGEFSLPAEGETVEEYAKKGGGGGRGGGRGWGGRGGGRGWGGRGWRGRGRHRGWYIGRRRRRPASITSDGCKACWVDSGVSDSDAEQTIGLMLRWVGHPQ
jgi:hypothetical protein